MFKKLILITIFLALVLPGISQDNEYRIHLGDLIKSKGNAYAFALNQNLRTTDSPTFAGLTLTAPLTLANGGTFPDVAIGQVLTSGGVGAAPAWSASPTVTGLTIGAGSEASPSLLFAYTYPAGFFMSAGYAGVGYSYNGTQHAIMSAYGIDMVQVTDRIGWGSGTLLYSDANHYLDQRNAANPQGYRIYGTYTSGTNYERGFLRATATAVEIGSEKGSGGGTARPLSFYTDGILREQIDISGSRILTGPNTQTTTDGFATVVVTTTAAATATATNLIPAGVVVLGVTCRNTSAIAGDGSFSGYSVGDGTDADRWGANVSPLINETTDLTDCTITSVPIYAAVTSIVLTQVGGSVFTAGGTVRITVHYSKPGAPAT